jgi:hypothetical protein
VDGANDCYIRNPNLEIIPERKCKLDKDLDDVEDVCKDENTLIFPVF